MNNNERISFMRESGIDFLYRYRSLTDESCKYEIEALQRKQIWLQNMSGLNDEREGSLSEHVWAHANGQLRKYRDNFGCFSMSSINPLEESSSYMWREYAKDGFCLAYSMKLLADLEIFMAPVQYVKTIDMTFLKENSKHPESIFVAKENKWSYENEWRHLDILKKPGNGEYYKTSVKPAKAYVSGKLMTKTIWKELWKCLLDMETEIVYMEEK